MSNRYTLNINCDEIGDIDKLIRTLKAWRPAFVVLMNGLMNDNYKRIRATIKEWNGTVIYRPYESSDGHLWRTRKVDEHVRLLENYAALDPDVWWYVSNEPLPGDDERALMQSWHSSLIDKAADKGLRLCVGNLAVAAMGDKNDIDGGRWDVFLRAVARHADKRVNGLPQILLGVHTYAHAVLPMHAAGRDPRDLTDPKKVGKDKWPSAAEVYSKPQLNWLVFREENLIQRAKAITGKQIYVAVTEGVGWDRMPNIVQQFPDVAKALDTLAGREVRGLPTVMQLLAVLFPGWTPEQAACEQMAWVDTIYPDYYLCFALFTWSQNREWVKDYDVSALDKFLTLWPLYIAEPQTPTPPVDPDLPTEGWYNAGIAAHPEPAFLYPTRAFSGTPLAKIETISMTSYKPVLTVYNPKLHPWRAVEFEGKRGWVNIEFGKFDKPEPPFDITPGDARWEKYRIYANGKTAPVYKKPTLGDRIGTGLQVGGVVVDHIPDNLLTPLERTYVNRADGQWLVVLLSTAGVGFVRLRDADKQEKADTKPPTPPVETIPKPEYDRVVAENAALREDLTTLTAENARLLPLAEAYAEIQQAVLKLVNKEPIILDAQEEIAS